jgi:hypothetical protein
MRAPVAGRMPLPPNLQILPFIARNGKYSEETVSHKTQCDLVSNQATTQDEGKRLPQTARCLDAI